MVDHTALKVNQSCIIALLVLAFVVGGRGGSAGRVGLGLVLFVAAVMAAGTIFPRAGLFKALYLYGLKPVGLLQPRVVREDPEQHRFAQGMGACVLLIGAALLALGAAIAGWVLVWLVVALALVNLVFDFCAGCFIYTQLRLHRFLAPSRAAETG
ncbi:MAG TPA: DUF4395 domain-containing protein [Chloroflexota bacterium]|nr:DUF4395 domain-containing protein [Chloroflexota bacterium]